MAHTARRRPHLHRPWLGSCRRLALVSAMAAPWFCACADIEPAPGANVRNGAAEAASPSLAHAPTGPGAGIDLHEPRGLCSTLDILPVTLFYDEFDDSLGSHYHGWKPPAGPPFYVCCGGPCAVDSELP